jgi:chromosome segregation ATPase
MRLNKLSELIHKSAQHGDCQTASVRVFFTDIIDQEDDPDAYTEVENSQFTVSRVVNRASTSKYFINNTAVDYKEVCDLL